MALSASIVLEVRQGGSDTNGGGFKTGASGTDWTLQDAAQYSVTDGVTAGTTTVTSATANFGTDVVGNLVYISGGTGSVAADWYEITSRTNSTTIVVDRSTGLTAGTGVTLKIGGALATPGQASVLLTVSGQLCWVKYNATPYNLTTSTAGAAGPISFNTSASNSIEGYDVTRGDRTANRPTYKWTAAAPGGFTYLCVLNSTTNPNTILNFIFDGNSVNNVGGVSVARYACSAINCTANNCNGTNGVGFLVQGTVVRCQAASCITGFSANGNFGINGVLECEATGCTTGFLITSFGSGVMKSIARGCTNGFSGNASSSGSYYDRCTADSCTTAGFVSVVQTTYVSCLSSNQSGAGGIGFSISSILCILQNCAAYNNTSNVTGTALVNEGFITLSVNPYINQAGADFRPNSASGGGALLRNAGIGVYGQTDNVDVGAVQHTEAVGAGVSIGF